MPRHLYAEAVFARLRLERQPWGESGLQLARRGSKDYGRKLATNCKTSGNETGKALSISVSGQRTRLAIQTSIKHRKIASAGRNSLRTPSIRPITGRNLRLWFYCKRRHAKLMMRQVHPIDTLCDEVHYSDASSHHRRQSVAVQGSDVFVVEGGRARRRRTFEGSTASKCLRNWTRKRPSSRPTRRISPTMTNYR
jgi:hypothetical protein